MRNTWLIIKREYLEKVRAKSFLLSTLAMPLIIGVFLLPGKLATMKSQGTKHLVVVSSDRTLAEKVQQELQKPASAAKQNDEGEESARELVGQYQVEISTDLSDAERNLLRDRLQRKEIDGYLWIGPEQVASRRVTYGRGQGGDFMDQSAIRSAVTDAFIQRTLTSHGMASTDVSKLLERVNLDVIQIQGGQEKKVNANAAFAAMFALVLLLYTTVLFYGVAVMRAVIEEKSSRIMEVLLSTVTAKELMAGKIIGVGAVGLTQIAIWSILAGIAAAPGAIAADLFRKAQISPMAIVCLGIFFILGYALYATMYAALGAVVNTEQEGQQMQIIIMLPLILAISLVMMVMRDPSGNVATWVSMVPLVSPVLMYLRIVVQTPPVWQIALSVLLLVGTIYGLLLLCSRVYRIGILMYGKRPTLPEIIKWVRYASV